MDVFSSRTPGSLATYIVGNLDALAPDGSPAVPEVWQAVETCEVDLSGCQEACLQKCSSAGFEMFAAGWVRRAQQKMDCHL